MKITRNFVTQVMLTLVLLGCVVLFALTNAQPIGYYGSYGQGYGGLGYGGLYNYYSMYPYSYGSYGMGLGLGYGWGR